MNLSLFADPYLCYCANEAGQRAILEELKDAARYAQERGVGILRRQRSPGSRSSHHRLHPGMPQGAVAALIRSWGIHSPAGQPCLPLSLQVAAL